MPFADITLSIAVASALAAGAGAVVLSALVFGLLIRRQRARAAELGERSALLEDRLEEVGRHLADAREESRRARLVAGLGSSIDLDAVLAQTLETAAGVGPVEAAMIVLPEADGGGPLVAF